MTINDTKLGDIYMRGVARLTASILLLEIIVLVWSLLSI